MRVPLSWLSDYVAVDLSVRELVRLLNFSGTKVKAVHQSNGELEGVVAARVVTMAPHPDADNLILVDVEEPGGEVAQVVCGARNFSVGDLVPFAPVGTRLPDMVIGERKIRGQISNGMLCSGRELGVGKDHSGILVLPPDVRVGQDVGEVLGLDDTVIELELTPNRPDCMGMVGIAREVAALTGAKLTPPGNESTETGAPSPVSVELPDPQGCPRYVATFIEDVAVAPSPSKIAARLLAAGLRPISNVVDATNYVMIEMGHPLHPFDAATVQDARIIVRRALTGETLTTLDGVKRELFPEDLVIADPQRGLGLAGVMGGANSEVSPETSAVILEAAYFDPASIARTSRRHQLRSEASARFERGMDPEILPAASARAAGLMTEIAGGAASAAVDLYPTPVGRPRISLRPKRSDDLLGVEIAPDRQAELLRSVGFEVSEGSDTFETQPPSFRPDVRREVDLIEEVARLEGLERLPSTLPPGRAGGLTEQQEAERVVRRTLAGLGVNEAWTNSFMARRDLDALMLPAEDPARNAVEIDNPMSEDEKLMRTTLLAGLLRAARHNLARASTGTALFEVARVYQPTDGLLPREATMLSGVFAGTRSEQSWNLPELKWDFFTVKGLVEALLDSVRLPAPDLAPLETMPFHPTRAARLFLGGTLLGRLGELHPDVCDAFEVVRGTLAFELDQDALLAALPGRPQAQAPPRYPAVLIDLAVVVDGAQEAAPVESAIRSAGSPETTAAHLFDVYTGPQVPEGKKSLAYALELRVPDRTLTDAEAEVVRERIVSALAERFGARLRT